MPLMRHPLIPIASVVEYDDDFSDACIIFYFQYAY